MYLQYELMKTLQKERLRVAARDHLAAEARRARTAGRDHAAATRAGATARGAATMARKRGAITGLGIPLGAILLFPQGIIPAVLKLAHARGRIWFLPLYLPKPLQWPACFVMIILGVAVYCYVLWTMRRLKKSSRELHAGKGGGRSPKSALTRIGTGQNLRKSHPSSSTPVRLDQDSDASQREPHRAVSAASTSGPGPKPRASRSATAGASPPASSTSTKPPRKDPDARPITVGTNHNPLRRPHGPGSARQRRVAGPPGCPPMPKVVRIPARCEVRVWTYPCKTW